MVVDLVDVQDVGSVLVLVHQVGLLGDQEGQLALLTLYLALDEELLRVAYLLKQEYLVAQYLLGLRCQMAYLF